MGLAACRSSHTPVAPGDENACGRGFHHFPYRGFEPVRRGGVYVKAANRFERALRFGCGAGGIIDERRDHTW